MNALRYSISPLALTDNRHRYQLREANSLHSDQVDYLKQSKGSLLLTPNPVSEVPQYTLRLVCTYSV